MRIDPGRSASLPSTELQQHQFQEGDTLGSIASQYGVSVESLLAQNPEINKSLLGQALTIPETKAGVSPIVETLQQDVVEVAEAPDFFSQLTGAAEQKVSSEEPIADRMVNLPLAQLSQEFVEKGDLFKTLISEFEEKLGAIGDDAQLANVDLQNVLQKQQQTLQMMSNISKMLYDTAQAIIRKLGS